MNTERIAVVIIIALSILVVGAMVLDYRRNHPGEKPTMVAPPKSDISETNFMTISNRVWLQLGGAAIVRVDEAEWKVLTNSYRTNLTTNAIVFWRRM